MRLKFKKIYFVGIFVGLAIILIDIYLYFFYEILKRWFIPVIILAVVSGLVQFWIDLYRESKRQKEIEIKFLEFSRNLVGNLASGVSIPMAVINVSGEDYGALTPYIEKLARQIEWGIPIHKALVTFANGTENVVIKRSVSIIIEADESGGDIKDIIQAVADSVVNIKKMKEERRSTIFSQVVQGYIVFFIFIGIMLILQLWLFPKISLYNTSDILSGDLGLSTLSGVAGVVGGGSPMELDFIFFSLILIQGFFAGIMIGKFSEGNIKHGLLHSLILMAIAALLVTTIKGGI